MRRLCVQSWKALWRPPRRATTWLLASSIVMAGSPVHAGPVLEYREGPRYCPRDRAPGSPAIAEADAIARARAWLPDGFCDPDRRMDGCDADAEYVHNSWRVYFHQYKLRAGQHDWQGLEHTYVILDQVGNCIANIPGTPEGLGP